jgi:hypothetical protein
MHTTIAAAWPLFALVLFPDSRPSLLPALQDFVAQRAGEFSSIPADRKQQLQQVADFVREQVQAGKPARLTFICTHNSRRSHLAQVWAQTAAAHYGVSTVETYSGGTEATAFNPRAIAALRRAGFSIPDPDAAQNPHYRLSFAKEADPLDCFSKVYHDAPNPAGDFCAVMVCGEADRNCPLVKGAVRRLAIPYDDPKAFDGTPQESEQYDQRCRQIAREMLYIFWQLRSASSVGVEGG